MGTAAKIAGRLYHDFLLPSKYGRYEQILKAASEKGYSFETVSSFDRVISDGSLTPRQAEIHESVTRSGFQRKKYLILRRDIDTRAFSVCRAMLAIET